MMLLNLAIFIVSMAVLVKGADWFTLSAERIGRSFRLSPFVIGVTLVAFGTSAPELVSSIFAVLAGSSEIVAGNVVGSNITNILLVLGFAALAAKELLIVPALGRVDLPALLLSLGLFIIAAWDGTISAFEGALGIALAAIYLYATLAAGGDAQIKKEMRGFRGDRSPKTIGLFLLSILLIYAGARYVIESALALAQSFSIGPEILGLTAIALGTSLPELTVSVAAARKGKHEIAVGNVLGSNIFNLLVVMGIPALISPLIITPGITHLSVPLLVLATLIYFLSARFGRITRPEGAIMVLLYVAFVAGSFLL